jgi:hypothetical protein
MVPQEAFPTTVCSPLYSCLIWELGWSSGTWLSEVWKMRTKLYGVTSSKNRNINVPEFSMSFIANLIIDFVIKFQGSRTRYLGGGVELRRSQYLHNTAPNDMTISGCTINVRHERKNRASGSIPGDFMWHSWWRNCHVSGFLSLSLIFPWYSSFHFCHRHLRCARAVFRQHSITSSVFQLRATSSMTRALAGYRNRKKEDFQNILLLRFALRRSGTPCFTASRRKIIGE